jgi:hypothetical protein
VPTGVGTSIDVALSHSGSDITFYEVKTYPNVKMSIREAFGQLMEYAYFPDRELANRLVIVSHASLGEQEKEYLQTLGNKFSIPLAYMQFDHESGKVVSEFSSESDS